MLYAVLLMQEISKKLVLLYMDYLILLYMDYDLQSFTKYFRQTLVFMWNRALRETFNFFFSGVLC